VLDKNYRSTGNILGGATAVILHNRHRTPKNVTAAGGPGEPILHYVGDDEEDEASKQRGVTLMTLHKAKGLEFPVVFLSGLDRDVIPSPRTVEEGGIEEERRLFYVGMTRAKKKLYLTCSATKVFYGKQRPVVPCPFIYEIPEQFMDGKFGEQQKQENEEFANNFFAEMKAKLAGKAVDAPSTLF
jgi:superfamily I DNA/RNA helicase